MNNLYPGNVVKFLDSGNKKLAVITQRMTRGGHYEAVTFAGQSVRINRVMLTNLCARTLDEYLSLFDVRTITINRKCAANLDNQPVYGLEAGAKLTGSYRGEGHPDNAEWSEGCIEIDTPKGTYAIPTEAVSCTN